MRVIWEHKLSVERKQGAEKLIADYVTSWIRQGYQIERDEDTTEIRIRATIMFHWGEE